MALGAIPGAIMHSGGAPRVRIPDPANFRPSTFGFRLSPYQPGAMWNPNTPFFCGRWKGKA